MIRLNPQCSMLVAITLLVGLTAATSTSTAQNQGTQNTQQPRESLSNATSNTTVPAMSSANWAVARSAWEASQQAVSTLNWQPLMNLMHENVTFTLAVPGQWRGLHRSKEAVNEYRKWHLEDVLYRVRYSLDNATTSPTTVAFEFEVKGTAGLPSMGTGPLYHHAVRFFDVRDGKVSHFSDYDIENDETEASFQSRGMSGVFGTVPDSVTLPKLPRRDPTRTGYSQAAAPPTMSSANLAVARRAFAAYKQSIETGQAQPFLDLLTDDVTFTIGSPGQWQGVRKGKARFAEVIRWRRDVLQLRGRVVMGVVDASANLANPRTELVTTNATTASFQFRVQGTARDQIYDEPLAIFFDVQGDRISGFREYYGVRRNTAASFRGTPFEDAMLGQRGTEARGRAEALAR